MPDPSVRDGGELLAACCAAMQFNILHSHLCCFAHAPRVMVGAAHCSQRAACAAHGAASPSRSARARAAFLHQRFSVTTAQRTRARATTHCRPRSCLSGAAHCTPTLFHARCVAARFVCALAARAHDFPPSVRRQLSFSAAARASRPAARSQPASTRVRVAAGARVVWYATRTHAAHRVIALLAPSCARLRLPQP